MTQELSVLFRCEPMAADIIPARIERALYSLNPGGTGLLFRPDIAGVISDLAGKR